MKKVLLVLALVIATFAFVSAIVRTDKYEKSHPVGMATTTQTPESTLNIEPEKKEKRLDASATFACRDFLRALQDMQAGILTTSEIREKSKTIYENAKLSESATIRAASRELLRTVTQNDVDGFGESLKAMTKVCTD